MLHQWKRHPFPVVARFRHCLVLAYALPAAVLEPLLPEGLTLDRFGDYGFVAIALVQTEALRPAFMPAALGKNFILSGYRIFSRYQTPAGKNLRGLRILRSDTDSNFMANSGNLLTHYHYRKVDVDWCAQDGRLEIAIRYGEVTELDVVADLTNVPAPLPSGSPFHDLKEARRFAGPLPFTFDYERETHSIVRIQGVRSEWNPTPVHVEVRENRFFDQDVFAGATPILANAFHIADIPYRWERGIREPLAAAA